MKRAVWGSVIVILGILWILIILTLTGRSTRETEIEQALAEAIDATMADTMKNTRYTMAETELFIADFLETLLIQLDSDSDVRISVLEADPVKGILSIEVTETYHHPNGKTGTVSSARTVIFDREQEEEQDFVQVSYFTAENELYKRYTIKKNSFCGIPIPPHRKGKVFQGWKYTTGDEGEAERASVLQAENGSTKEVLSLDGKPLIISEDVSLIAVFQ